MSISYLYSVHVVLVYVITAMLFFLSIEVIHEMAIPTAMKNIGKNPSANLLQKNRNIYIY